MTELSVVLISKNQEWNIARLVESVLKETAPLSSKEIILVDSASTDRTTEIAARYPITVLKLHPEQRLTPSAGRYIGYQQSTGDLVLFLDGDMELCNGWLAQAINIMHSRTEIAVITGKVLDCPVECHQPAENHIEALTTNPVVVEILHGGGAAMYRRSVLQQVGTFNPSLYSDEEPELCIRIRHAGYVVVRLSNSIVYHYTAQSFAISTLIQKRRRNFFLGYGQNMRFLLGKPLFWTYVKERGWAIAPALILLAGMISALISLLRSQWIWLGLWMILILLLIVGISIKKRSLQRALFTLLSRLLILEGTIHGFFLGGDNQPDLTNKYDIIRNNRNPSCGKELGLCQSKSYPEKIIIEQKGNTTP